MTQDAAVALQYSATEGLASLRDYLAGRLAALEGQRPGPGELMVTSGGIDCMELLAKSLIDPGDVVTVEAPTYLGAIMAFRGYEADVRGVPMDDGGLRVDVLARQLAAGLRPKLLYTIPEHQNPTGLCLAAERRQPLVDLARRYGFLIWRTWPTASSASTPPARRACGAWPRTWSCRPGRSPRSSSPAYGSAGRRARPAHRRALHGQAELRPVLRRARPADAGGVRPRRPPRRPAGRVPGAVPAARRADHPGARRAHARPAPPGQRRPAGSSPG